MINRFRTLFTVRISHAYYDGVCRDFQFVLPNETVRILRGGRAMIKELEGVHHIIVEVDESNVPLGEFAGGRLRLGLKLVNPYFTNITSVGDDFASVVQVYGNRDNYKVLQPAETAVPVAARLIHPLAAAVRPVTVVLKNRIGEHLRREVIADAERTEVAFELGGISPGMFTVEEYSSGYTESARYYLDPDLRRLGISGIIEIDVDERFYSGEPPEFEIAFEARQERLVYQVIARNYGRADAEELSIVDSGSGKPVNFAPPDFLPADNPADSVIVFTSDGLVSRRQQGRKRMQLMKKEDVLITHLPQPGADKADAKMTIHILKP